METRRLNLWILLLLSITVMGVKAKDPKWEIACQAYTFKEFSLAEALEKMEELDIRLVELFPGQKMSSIDDRKTHFSMDKDQISDLKALLKKHKIKACSYGVISPRKEADWEALFKFAKTMGIKTIVSEPMQEQLALVDELCQKYKIRVAIHNHPDPTRYWNPEIVAKALDGRSNFLGVCADVGHWTRSGLDVTDCLKKLEGRIFEIHMKDVNKTDKTGHAVVWGEGIIDWGKAFKELKHQNFDGPFVIEHEYNWQNPMPDLKKNLAFFRVNK